MPTAPPSNTTLGPSSPGDLPNTGLPVSGALWFALIWFLVAGLLALGLGRFLRDGR